MKPQLCASLLALAFNAHALKVQEVLPPAAHPGTTVSDFSTNLETVLSRARLPGAITSHPTQVVRLTGDVHTLNLACGEVIENIHAFYTRQLTSDDFYYNTYINCWYDPKTEDALGFSIDSYFDALNDTAWQRALAWIAEHQGEDFLGTPFRVESARGLVVSLNIDAGNMDDPQAEVLERLRHDNNTLYFENTREMLDVLMTDIRARFFSNEREQIIPFLQQWIFSRADSLYPRILRHSNTVFLQPERIFLMDEAPKAYTSPMRMYFAHHCEKYPNQRCLG